MENQVVVHAGQLDSLINDNAKLEARCAALENQIEAWETAFQEESAKRRKAEAERDRLLEALKEYGDHHIRCASMDDFKCDCGFDAALQEGE